jgi:gluconolactonase
MSWTFELVAGPFEFTEGPVWDGEAVLFSDIPPGNIVRYVPETGESTVFRTEEGKPNGLKLSAEGDLYGCEMAGRRMARYDEDGTTTTIVDEYDGKRLHKPNDLCFDDQGRMWFSDPDYDVYWVEDAERELDHDSIYRVDLSSEPWTAERMTFDTQRPNGLLISPDQSTLYVAEMQYGDGNPRELRSYPILDDGSLGEYEVLHNFYPHRGIDGMCLDEDGNIVACAGWPDSGPGPMIYVIAPDGRVLETHPFPGGSPTNCTFGEDLSTLYVTEGDGGLYRAETDRVGYLGAP